jgi:Flp pilus assembly protein TadD
MAKAIRMQPGYIPARCALAELYLRQGDLGAARGAVLDALDIAPSEPSLYDILLKIDMASGDEARTARDALEGIRACPGGGEGRWHRVAAVCMLRAGERETARAILGLGLKTFPGDPDLLRLMGMA